MAIEAKTTPTIYHADDEPAIGLLISETLKFEGYRVRTFDNPYGLVQAVTEDPYEADLVITDGEMPGMKGWEMVTVIRAEFGRLEPPRHVPAILLTSGTDRYPPESPQFVKEMGDYGVDWIIAKPHKAVELIAVVNQYLRP